MIRKSSFISTIAATAKSLWTGIRLTIRHFKDAKQQRTPLGVSDPEYFKQQSGLFTTLYPHERLPLPDHGRHQLHNEIEDCIVCDLCAKVCPVDCIDIQPIKSPEEIGKTSDGSSKRIYAAKFDIDMAKCCYCGLCTTVCPTECLTMTNNFDYSEFDVRNMIFNFSELSPEQAIEKRKIYDEAQRLKAEAKAKVAVGGDDVAKPSAKPVFKPIIKTGNSTSDKAQETNIPQTSESAEKPTVEKPKPVFKPTIKNPSNKDELSATPKPEIETPKPKPVFKPIIKPPVPRKTDIDPLDTSNSIQ